MEAVCACGCGGALTDTLGPLRCGICGFFFNRACLGLHQSTFVGGTLSRCRAVFVRARAWQPDLMPRLLHLFDESVRIEASNVVTATNDNKRSHLKMYKEFCTNNGVLPAEALPVSGPMPTELLVLYLTALATDKSAKAICGGTFLQRVSTFNSWHKARGLPPPSANPEIQRRMEGWKREIGQRGGNVVKPKLPFTVDMLKLELDYLDAQARQAARAAGCTLAFRARRDALILIFGFFGLLRKSEIAAARVGLVHFTLLYLALRIPRAKADQLSVGHTQFFSFQTASGVDIGYFFHAYLAELRARGLDGADAPLFPHVTSAGIAKSKFMPSAGSCISAMVQAALQRIAAAAARVGLVLNIDPSLYASHSLRRGGLNHALDCGIPREARQVMGRWSGESSQDTYIMWDVPQRVAFTAHM